MICPILPSPRATVASVILLASSLAPRAWSQTAPPPAPAANPPAAAPGGKVKPTAPPAEAPQPAKWPKELHVAGNQLQTPDGKAFWLQGVNIESLEWNPKGEYILAATKEAIENWKANCIRLPVKEAFWFGRGEKKVTQTDGGAAYRALIDEVVNMAANRGAYVVLDLHRFGTPKAPYVEFWKDAATHFKNNPAVLFDIMNEPHGISWEIWRDGGFVEKKQKKGDEAAFGGADAPEGDKAGTQSPGMQGLVNAVRETGAKNIVVAGGLDYAYDLTGPAGSFQLTEKGGNGIMYSTHIYPWKKGWQSHVLAAAAKFPIFVGEVGASTTKMSFIPANNQEDPSTWVPDMLGLIQKYHLNWTAFSFHPKSAPNMLMDWKFTPTPYWGTPAREALAGKQYPLGRLR